MRVLLVDDHPLFLEGMQNLLVTRAVNVVGTAHDGHDALEKVRQLQPDVVLMDIQMPHCDGLEATRLIKAESPETKIVMLTMSADDEHLFEAVKSGASGYLLKSLESDRFFDLLQGLERDEAAMSRELATKVLSEFANPTHQPQSADKSGADSSDLTVRQMEVLQLAAKGHTNKEIGEVLVITERTVKYHMREILQKLHLRNRAQVVAFAMSTGLVDPETVLDYTEVS